MLLLACTTINKFVLCYKDSIFLFKDCWTHKYSSHVVQTTKPNLLKWQSLMENDILIFIYSKLLPRINTNPITPEFCPFLSNIHHYSLSTEPFLCLPCNTVFYFSLVCLLACLFMCLVTWYICEAVGETEKGNSAWRTLPDMGRKEWWAYQWERQWVTQSRRSYAMRPVPWHTVWQYWDQDLFFLSWFLSSFCLHASTLHAFTRRLRFQINLNKSLVSVQSPLQFNKILKLKAF